MRNLCWPITGRSILFASIFTLFSTGLIPLHHLQTFIPHQNDAVLMPIVSLLPATPTVRAATYTIGSNPNDRDLTFNSARLTLTGPNANEITGRVFRDYDADGTRDSLEGGVPGITVTAYLSSSVIADQVTTDANGYYTITQNVPNGRAVRIEFTGLPDYLQPGANGTNSSSSVVFVTSPATTIDLAVNNPANYCQSNPSLVTNCYVEGDAPASPALDVLVSVPYTASGTAALSTHEAYHTQLGTTFGLAYQRSSNTLFAATYHKRHTAYGTADSTGAIYAVPNPSDNSTAGISVFLDLNTLYGSNVAGTNPHPSGSDFYTDTASYDPVGKIALGDIDIAEDELSLWAVNLADRQLYHIPIGTDPTNPVAPVSTASIQRYPLYNLYDCDGDSTLDTVSDVDLRPFAVKVRDGKIYIGAVCSAESTPADFSKLKAIAFEFDPTTTTFTHILAFTLTYNRGCGITYHCFWHVSPQPYAGSNTSNWRPWDPTYDRAELSWYDSSFREGGYPQPMFTDIEFTENGDMIVGLRDRFGDQIGDGLPEPNSATLFDGDATGDILLAASSGISWTISTTQATHGTEFFDEDNYSFHDETSMAGLTIVPGTGQVVYTVVDPVSNLSGGLDWTQTANGTLDQSYQIYRRPSGTSGSSELFAKANGLGDLEALCSPAPIEVGNRIWHDTDGDGIQGADESGIDGVVITLISSGGSITTTTTNGGQYLFSSNGNAASILAANSFYTITVDTTQGGLSGLNLTTVNADGDGSNNAKTDLRDSDASLSGTTAIITLTTGAAGANNHTFDLGFSAFDWGDLPDIAIGIGSANYQTLDNDNGARHVIVPGLYMGSTVDAEADGQPHTDAYQDDGNGTAPDDEDGVRLADLILTEGSNATIRITATNTTTTAATLYGWIDFNGSGGFLDLGESQQVAVPTSTINGQFSLNFGTVPNSSPTTTYARFRLSTDVAAASPIGSATDGEVEDYVVSIGSALLACPTDGNVGGTVFRDYNADGDQDINEPRIMGTSTITVTAYGKNNLVLGVTTVQRDGTYVFSPNLDLTNGARIEFSGLPTQNGPFGGGPTAGAGTSGTSVQFISAASCQVDLGLNDPTDYCQAQNSLQMVTTCFVNGRHTGGTAANGDVLVSFAYTQTGAIGAAGYISPTKAAINSQIGSTWGLAYRRSTQTLYASAIMKRHADFGPLGSGGLYAIDYSNPSSPVPTSFLDLNTLAGVDVGTDPRTTALPPNLGDDNADADAYPEVGKRSLGDIDISEDGQTLYIMNLHNRELIALDIGTQTVNRQIPVGNPGCTSATDVRPWAVKVHDSQVYIGVVCSAQSTQNADDLHFYVMRLDGTTFVTVYHHDLDYTKGYPYSGTPNAGTNWNPWTDNWDLTQAVPSNSWRIYPQPILSDIEFDDDGSMILSLMDRLGHQTGVDNHNPSGSGVYKNSSGGDILRVCHVNSTFYMEGTPQCPSNMTNGEGPGGGEFYQADNRADIHLETFLGALALLPGSNEVIGPVYTPNGSFSGGVRWFSNQDGTENNSYELYRLSGSPGVFGKAAGLGDVELLCEPTPLEIGNRVWNDSQLVNGIQDSCEPGIPNVDVGLYNITGTLIATTTTDNNGEYYFNQGNVSGGLQPNTTYQIRIALGQSALLTYTSTLPNYNGDSGTSDVHDSDGDPNIHAGFVTAPVTTGSAGKNDHTYDFGFYEAPLSFELAKIVNTVGPVRTNDSITFTIRITNTGSVTVTTLPLTDTYQTAYLSFVTATIAPDDLADDGQLNWSDVVSSGGQSIGPTTTLGIIVEFRAVADTTHLTSSQTINMATIYTQTAQAPIQIINPTAVDIIKQSVQYADSSIEIAWSTATEVDIVGFHLHRQRAGEALAQLTTEPIIAQNAGQAIGAAYLYQDQDVSDREQVQYLLEILSVDGSTSYVVLGSGKHGGTFFLPMIMLFQ